MEQKQGNPKHDLLCVVLAASLCLNVCYFLDFRQEQENAIPVREETTTMQTSVLYNPGTSENSDYLSTEPESFIKIEPTETPVPTQAPKSAPSSQATLQYEGATVYITKSGKKFHRETCSSLSKSKIPILYEEAYQKNYTACGRCNP